MRLRELQPGQSFVLMRTMERFTVVKKNGRHSIVNTLGSPQSLTLHGSCEVELTQGESIGQIDSKKTELSTV